MCNKNIEAYTDANWAKSITDRKSTTGYCTFVWGNLVTWRSKKQSMIARSDVEAQHVLIMEYVRCYGWLKRLKNLLMKLYYDNKAAINIAYNSVQHDRTKHIEVDKHFIKEKLEAEIVCVPFVLSMQQIIDIFTKALFRPNFEFLVVSWT